MAITATVCMLSRLCLGNDLSIGTERLNSGHEWVSEGGWYSVAVTVAQWVAVVQGRVLECWLLVDQTKGVPASLI